MITTVDTTTSRVAADLVTAFQGRDGIGLRILKDAAAQLEDVIRQRILADAAALGADLDTLAAHLDGSASPAPQKPAARTPKARPEAPADDTAFLALLEAELAKGPATALALAKRFTGATKERVGRLLCASLDHDLTPLHRNGLKWSRVTT